MESIPTCECGAKEQSANLIITPYSIHHSLRGARGLFNLDDQTVAYLSQKCLSI